MLLRGKPLSEGKARRSDSELLVLPVLLCLQRTCSVTVSQSQRVTGVSVAAINIL